MRTKQTAPWTRQFGLRERALPLMLVTFILACAPVAPSSPAPHPTEVGSATQRQVTPTLSDVSQAAAITSPVPLAPGLKIEVVADGLQLPANLAFAPDGRLFLTEVTAGTIRIIEQGRLLPEPAITLEVANDGEQGLLGMALAPDFDRTHHLYVYYSEPKEGVGLRNRVVRLTESGNRVSNLEVVLDNLPINNTLHNASHNGGRLAFGPDGKLYVTTGDIGKGLTAQDKQKLAGKILRINPDGSIPSDNPFPGSPVYALGLRNSYGIGFHPLTGVPYGTDNGPQGHDEVNRIEGGANYGSPDVNGIRNNPRFVDPIWDSGAERGGISGMTFYTGARFPQYGNDLLFCTFSSGRLRRLRLTGDRYETVQSQELLSDQCYLDVLTGPDGAIYMTSFNKVQRLVPAD